MHVEKWLKPAPPPTQCLSSSTFKVPPIDGSLTLPQIYDLQLQQSPNHRIFVIPEDVSESRARTIYWHEAVAAVYTGARILKNRVGKSFTNPLNAPVVAILSTSDTIPYFITMVSILRADMVFIPVSPRNSAPAVAHLLKQVHANHVLVGHDTATIQLAQTALGILTSDGYDTTQITTSPMLLFDDLFIPLDQVNMDPSDLPLTRLNSGDVVMYLHSSGSTAFPKAIAWTNNRIIEMMHVPWYGEQDLTDVVWSLHGMPMYHGMGFLQTSWTASCGLVVASFTPKNPAVIPTPDSVFNSAKATGSDLVFCVPSFIESWSRDPERVKWLSERVGVLFGGGPLNKEAGDHLTAEGVSIYMLYGSTEGGVMSPIVPAKGSAGNDWEYFRFADLICPEMVAYDDNNSYELVMMTGVLSTPGVINAEVRGTPSYATSDLMRPHPTKKGYWRIFGRVDDQIMHNTGEKTNPGPLENMLTQDPHVQAAVMFGRGHFNAGVLIEPKPEWAVEPGDDEALEKFRNLVWPTIQEMNEFAPQHSRLFREMIILVNPAKPFTYTAKNTVRRQAVINDYAEEIEKLYETVDDSAQPSVDPPAEWNAQTTKDFVSLITNKVLVRDVRDDDDIFEYGGCDSLQATWILNTLLRALRYSTQVDGREWTKNPIYDHPTISRLSAFVMTTIKGSTTDSTEMKRVEEMEAMVQNFSSGFPALKERDLPKDAKVVLLTGGTGALGSSLLVKLLDDKNVAKIYVLNRPDETCSPLERQSNSFMERGLPKEKLGDTSRLVVLGTNFNIEKLGLDEKMYQEIASSVTHIIHNAWRVDFNLSLASFKSNLRGLRELIDLSLSSGAHLQYLSSMGIFQNTHQLDSLDEEPLTPEVAIGSGYTESKWVSEELIRRSGLQKYMIVRVGQVCGDTESGVWNKKEWAPTMIQSALTLGCLPDDKRTISWIPVNITAQALVEFLDCPQDQVTTNLAHPNPITWSEIAEDICKEIGGAIKVSTYSHWLEKLDRGAPKNLPAVQLLPFYKSLDVKSGAVLEAFGLPKMELVNGKVYSQTLSSETLPPLSRDDAVRWVRHWKKIGWISG